MLAFIICWSTINRIHYYTTLLNFCIKVSSNFNIFVKIKKEWIGLPTLWLTEW